MKESKNILCKIWKVARVFLVALLVIVVVLAIYINVSPVPVARFIRSQFTNTGYTTIPEVDAVKNEVNIEQNLKYPSEFNDNTYDVYKPKDQSKVYPTIIWTHGGAFVGGDKNDLYDFSILLASKGYTVVQINYERAPEAKYPTPVKQLGEAYKWLKSNKSVNLDQVVFAGDSAGAQITSQFLAIQTNTTYAKMVNIDPVVDSKTIKGTVLYCGPYDMTQFSKGSTALTTFIFSRLGWSYFGSKDWIESDEVKYASTVNYVDENFPPSYITDGNTGSFEAQAREFESKLKSKGVSVTSRYFDKNEYETGHEFQFKLDTMPSELVVEDTVKFLEEQFATL